MSVYLRGGYCSEAATTGYEGITMDFRFFVAIIMSATLVNNYVLRQFLGVCPFLGVSKEKKSAIGMGLAVTFVMIIATAVTWPAQIFLLNPSNLEFLQTIVFIIIIATVVQLLEIVLKKFFPPLYRSLGIYLPLMTTNCAVFALTITNINSDFGFIESLLNALGAGVGFLLAMALFSSIREQLDSAEPPETFAGLPLILISAAILSLAFFGFDGIVDNLFG
jgi:electron transport complex protein RnfA